MFSYWVLAKHNVKTCEKVEQGSENDQKRNWKTPANKKKKKETNFNNKKDNNALLSAKETSQVVSYILGMFISKHV